MNNTNLELIRQKCIEANPEIVELKFGCIVLDENGIQEHVIYSVEEFMTGNLKVKLDATAVLIRADELKCIIGSPIRFGDVLLTLEKNLRPSLQLEKYWQTVHALIAFWNLRKDDLNEQSEETLDFIASLLS